jgi:hypothetical protein
MTMYDTQLYLPSFRDILTIILKELCKIDYNYALNLALTSKALLKIFLLPKVHSLYRMYQIRESLEKKLKNIFEEVKDRTECLRLTKEITDGRQTFDQRRYMHFPKGSYQKFASSYEAYINAFIHDVTSFAAIEFENFISGFLDVALWVSFDKDYTDVVGLATSNMNCPPIFVLPKVSKGEKYYLMKAENVGLPQVALICKLRFKCSNDSVVSGRVGSIILKDEHHELKDHVGCVLPLRFRYAPDKLFFVYYGTINEYDK